MVEIIIIACVLLLAYGIIKAGAMQQAHNDEIRRQEYQKRNDTKGGSQ